MLVLGASCRCGRARKVRRDGGDLSFTDSDVSLAAHEQIEIAHAPWEEGIPHTRNRLTPPSG